MTDPDLAQKILKVYKMYKKTQRGKIRRGFDKLVGGFWGFFDGMCTGGLVGCNVTGAGGWLWGLCGNIVGAALGLIVGAASGTVSGVIGDKDVVAAQLHDYRQNFGFQSRKFERSGHDQSDNFFKIM